MFPQHGGLVSHGARHLALAVWKGESRSRAVFSDRVSVDHVNPPLWDCVIHWWWSSPAFALISFATFGMGFWV